MQSMSLNKIIGAIAKADRDYDLIHNGDKIAVGVSGGKDSVVLLYALSLYRKTAKRYSNKDFQVIGIHLEMGFGGMDFSPLIDFCKEKEIPYYDYPTKLYEILKLHPNNHETISCALCSKLKKGAIVKAAKEYGCNKVAFAHHADDAIETLFLNMIYGGRINTFEPEMFLTNQQMDFIRPLIYVYEEEIRNTAIQLALPIIQSTCPNDGFTKRQDIKEFLRKTYTQFPMARHNFLISLQNEEQTKLWVKVKK